MNELREAGFERILLLVFTIYLFLLWAGWPLLRKLAKKLSKDNKEDDHEQV